MKFDIALISSVLAIVPLAQAAPLGIVERPAHPLDKRAWVFVNGALREVDTEAIEQLGKSMLASLPEKDQNLVEMQNKLLLEDNAHALKPSSSGGHAKAGITHDTKHIRRPSKEAGPSSLKEVHFDFDDEHFRALP